MIALLDLDGTLIDSGPVIFDAARFALTALGLPEPEDMRPFVGPPLREGMQSVLGVPASQVDEAMRIYRGHQMEHLADTAIYEGIPAALTELRERGWVLAVATSKFETVAQATTDLLGLTGLVDALAGGDQVSSAKAVVIERALAKLQVEPGDSPIMVGDRMHDIEGAHAHGLRSVFAAWGYGSPEESDGATAIAASPGTLVATLTSLI